MKEELFCIKGGDTIEHSIECVVHDYEPGKYTIVEYERIPVKSKNVVEWAFEYLDEQLHEKFGNFEYGDLLSELDFSKFKSEIEQYIDANLKNYNCRETGHEFDVIVDEDGSWEEA